MIEITLRVRLWVKGVEMTKVVERVEELVVMPVLSYETEEQVKALGL